MDEKFYLYQVIIPYPDEACDIVAIVTTRDSDEAELIVVTEIESPSEITLSEWIEKMKTHSLGECKMLNPRVEIVSVAYDYY